MKAKKAFTLIELLVVISIIALLMAVMMPALGRAREQAKMVVCRSSLKTLVLGSTLWSEDHNGWAIAGAWYSEKEQFEDCSITSYVDSSKEKESDSFVCPSAKNIDFYSEDEDFDTTGNEKKFTYAANGYMTLDCSFEGSPGTTGPGTDGIYGPDNVYWQEHGVTKIQNIRLPQSTVYFIDHEYYAAFSWTFNPHKDPETFPEGYRYKTRWHKKKSGDWYGLGNIGWVDGHVSVEPDDFESYRDEINKRDAKWKYYFYDH